MNEKEVRDLADIHSGLNGHEADKCPCNEAGGPARPCWEAVGYLEAIEKARGLEEALEKISKYECDCFSGCGPCLDITNRVAAETLTKWQEEK